MKKINLKNIIYINQLEFIINFKIITSKDEPGKNIILSNGGIRLLKII